MTTNARREGFADEEQSIRTMMRVFAQPPEARWFHLNQFINELYVDAWCADDAPTLDELQETFHELAAYVGLLATRRAWLAYRAAEMNRRRAERRVEEEKVARSLDRLISYRLDVAADLSPAEQQVLDDALKLQTSITRTLEVSSRRRPRQSPRTLHLAKHFVCEVRVMWSYLLQRDMSCATDRQMIRFATAVWRDAGFYEPDFDLFGWFVRHFRDVKTF